MRNAKKIPLFVKATATGFAALVVFAVVRPALTGGTMPRFWPLLIGVLSSALLYFIRHAKNGSTGLMRMGFYIGLFAFFVAFPIVSPDEVNPEISEDVHWVLGWALFLSVVGFEIAYWVVGVLKKPIDQRPLLLQPSKSQKRLLMVILGLGLLAWFFSVWDYSQAINAPISSVLLSMRGVIEGGNTQITKPGLFSIFMASGIFVSAVAATMMLTLYRLPIPFSVMCWMTLIACALIGFLSGSRALFLYSFIPLAITGWKKLSALRFMTSIRWPGAIAAGVMLIVVWSVMSAMRGADIREYEGGFEDISLVAPAQGALDIYSMTAEVVETFPNRIPYVQGESVLPLVLGWVPRSMWPAKPYPFGLYMNLVQGETIQARAASLAVGLTGEGYGNFGLFGAFLWAFVLGVACRLGDRLVDRLHRDDALHLLLGGMSMVWVAMIVRGGVPEMFYMGLQIMVLPVLLARYFFAGQEKKKKPTATFGRLRRLPATSYSLTRN